MISKSIRIWKNALFIVLAILMLPVFNFMYEQYNTNKYPASPRLSVICWAFMRMQPIIEGELYNERISDAGLKEIYGKWDDFGMEDKNIFSSITFGRNGEFIAISDPLKVAVVIRPDFQSRIWNYETFPKVSYRSMCDKFPRSFELIP